MMPGQSVCTKGVNLSVIAWQGEAARQSMTLLLAPMAGSDTGRQPGKNCLSRRGISG